MARGFFLESREMEVDRTRRGKETQTGKFVLQKKRVARWRMIGQEEEKRHKLESLCYKRKRSRAGARSDKKKRKRGLIVLLGWGWFGELLAFCLCL